MKLLPPKQDIKNIETREVLKKLAGTRAALAELKGIAYYWFELNSIKILGTGSTVKGIQLSGLKSLKFLLPPLTEQRKIATILSTWDKAIKPSAS